jgi:3-hydroxyisobutyrate dehydrogenase
MKIGLIGLGNMGYHFGTRLLAAGQDLVVFDTNPAALARLQQQGAQTAGSPRELADQAEIVLLCLSMPSIVESVTSGAEGVMHGKAIRTIVDLSTTGPSVTESAAAKLALKNISWIGSPVSGGTTGAEKGTLTLMASGPQAAYQEVHPILSILGKNIFYLGAQPGLGQTMKIVNNTLCAVSIVASCETLVYGAKAGLDPQTMLDVINVSSGRSFATQEKIPQCIVNREFPTRFTTDLLHKDIKLCMEEAEKLGVPMTVSPAARQFLAFAISQGDGPRDYANIIRHIEGWAGQEFGQAAGETSETSETKQ